LGVIKEAELLEGWIDWKDAPLADGLLSSFHFFGGVQVKPLPDTEMEGTITKRSGVSTEAPAYTYKKHGQGFAAMIGFHIPKTFRTIQQGVPVTKDGVSAPDGTALIQDDLLKSDDSVVLDWQRDRGQVGEQGVPFFKDPVLDEMRVWFMRLLHKHHDLLELPFAQVWFWPEGITAIGHISHDSDGNSKEGALQLLDRLAEGHVKSSWCVIMPGYDKEIYERIVSDGHEVAFHYNALGTEENSLWREDHFRAQLTMLQGQAGQEVEIITNKNHYLRWEGDVSFYQWCERAGIKVEQSMGGTKQGNKGFLAGTCHPYKPMSNATERNRLMDVVAMPTLAWDPPNVLRCTIEEAKVLVDRAADVYGVAHFLVHPGQLLINENVGPGLVELAQYGTGKQLPWWTSEQIYNWLQIKRGVTVTAAAKQELGAIANSDNGNAAGAGLRIQAEQACEGLTVVCSSNQIPVIPENGPVRLRSAKQVERYGIMLLELIVDVPAGVTIIPLADAAVKN
jgi:hypothetical protein